MFYIKLTDDMELIITARDAIYRGDHLNQKLTFLVPMQVGDIDPAAAALYLSYIRADGTAEIDLLHREKELYNDSYYQFTMPVTSKLTRYAGPVTAFLTIYTGPANAPVISKSGECMLQVQASTNMDDIVTDQGLSLIYSMQKEMEEKLAEGLAGRANGLAFDDDTRELQLKSGETMIGDPVIVSPA